MGLNSFLLQRSCSQSHPPIPITNLNFHLWPLGSHFQPMGYEDCNSHPLMGNSRCVPLWSFISPLAGIQAHGYILELKTKQLYRSDWVHKRKLLRPKRGRMNFENQPEVTNSWENKQAGATQEKTEECNLDLREKKAIIFPQRKWH